MSSVPLILYIMNIVNIVLNIIKGCEELNCTQQCIPSDDNSTSTSATCACFDGFSLAEDGRKCNGKSLIHNEI